ncbi:hypothetical protein HX109_01005 [Galbibacter sp. BG1]|uniref:DUF6588 family protein n=1 Tax=Galbibacter sp. BG1 TaxID=1170699 RepID=UPI0015BE8063|nr:DUF6588 family protein [Galbibacter sp. BG1]QLE00208.1 hypothetical protein HX109_01005 [Galbibacter sp. BG1]
MKKLSMLAMAVATFCATTAKAQDSFDALLAAGVDDAQRFTNDFLAPGTDALMYGINNGWYNTAKVKPLLGFEISVMANAGVIKDDQKEFWMDTNDYENVSFVQGPAAQNVGTVLGENDPTVLVEVTYDDPIFGNESVELELPNGLAAEGLSFLPTAFLQGSIGLSFGTEFKARFIPKINAEDTKIGMYGFGLQHEFTHWLPADKLLPVAISGLISYTHLDGEYDFTDTSGIDGENQRLENSTNTWLFQAIASTKLPIINFYGGIGYLSGKSESDILGTYIVTDGILQSEAIVDPYSVSSSVSGVRGTFGTRLKLGFFRFNADYTFAEYDSFSVGLNFGFR